MKKKWEKPIVKRIPCDLSQIQGDLSTMPEAELIQALRELFPAFGETSVREVAPPEEREQIPNRS